MHPELLISPELIKLLVFGRYLGYIEGFKEKEMILSIACILAGIVSIQPQAFQFQSETVPHQDMNKSVLSVELTQLALTGSEAMHMIVRFAQPVNAETRAILHENGFSIQSPLGGASYVALINPSVLNPRTILSNADVREVRPFDSIWKLHRFLADGQIPTWTMPTPTTRAACPWRCCKPWPQTPACCRRSQR